MIKKAASLRYPPQHQPQRNSLGTMNPRPPPAQAMQPQQPVQMTQSQPEGVQDSSQIQWQQQQQQQPQQFPQKQPHRQGTGFSYSDQDSLWQIGENAYSYRTEDPKAREKNLRIYRELVGITTSAALQENDTRVSTTSYLCFGRPARNVGYYQRIVDDELKASIWYTTATWTINVLLGLQIAIAAVLTALGVTTDPRRGLAISVLAACNTATATLLAYLKAKGQPLRALQYRDAMRQLKEHIEYTERLFELGITGGGELNPEQAAADVKQHYDKVQAEQEKSEETSEAAKLEAHPAAAAGSPVEPKPGQKPGIGSDRLTSPTTAAANPPSSAHDAAARLV